MYNNVVNRNVDLGELLVTTLVANSCATDGPVRPGLALLYKRQSDEAMPVVHFSGDPSKRRGPPTFSTDELDEPRQYLPAAARSASGFRNRKETSCLRQAFSCLVSGSA